MIKAVIQETLSSKAGHRISAGSIRALQPGRACQCMKNRLSAMSAAGIPTEFHSYQGLPHGFGLGQGTVAEGWIDDAVRFWEANTK